MEPLQNSIQDQLIAASTASKLLAISKATFYRYVSAGLIPRGIKFGQKMQSASRWRLSDILNVMNTGSKERL